MLPHDIAAILADLTEGVSLKSAASDVSARYRREDTGTSLAIRNDTEALAYAAARMPATFAAITHVLDHIDGPTPQTMLDFGAGPGTATLAAKQFWPDIQPALLEPNAAMRGMAKKFLPDAAWTDRPVKADIVIAGYVLNELSDPIQLAKTLWDATNDKLILVDTGTPAGYAMMMRVRDALIGMGAHLHAPCPHVQVCPYAKEESGWCHFAVRLERTRLHKDLKGGALGYEDEKFTYLVFGRTPKAQEKARIVGHPRINKVIDVLLCTPDGTLNKEQVAKRDPRYKPLKKSRWGDTL